jgi:hypothetical protein
MEVNGSYLELTAAITTAGAALVRAVLTDRASRPLAGPLLLANMRDRAAGAITEPLDGGALTLG